jgi:uncharacterized lipoprotein YmbA
MGVVLSLAILMLAACGGGSKAVKEPNFYLLRANEGALTSAPLGPFVLGINRIALADYLAQPGIVVATEGSQVRPARQHLWAEPLDFSLRLFIRDAVSSRVGYAISADTGRRQEWDYRLDVRIDEWHGSLAGQTRIDASWIVIDMTSDEQIIRRRFQQTGVLSDDGYDALVATQTELLDALAAAIAESLASLGT